MKKILIIGNSIAGAKAAEEIRSQEVDCEILMIFSDGHYPHDRYRLGEFISSEIKAKELLYKDPEFYKDKNIGVMLNTRVKRINFKRKKIFTENKEQIDYDVLIITDFPSAKISNIKGSNKKGIYKLRDLNNIDDIMKEIPFFDTVVVQSDSLLGLNMSIALAAIRKEVFLLISDEESLWSIFDSKGYEYILKILNDSGVKVLSGSSVTEILGDNDVKAVRLSSGKVLGTQMIIFGETTEHINLINNSELKKDRKIVVNDSFKTSYDDVYAVDNICEVGEESGNLYYLLNEEYNIKSVLEQQGVIVGNTILGKEADICFSDPFSYSLNLNEASIVFIGSQLLDSEELKEYRSVNEDENKYKYLYIFNNIVVGAVIINDSKEIDKFLHLIKEKVNVVEDDVDFLEGFELYDRCEPIFSLSNQ